MSNLNKILKGIFFITKEISLKNVKIPVFYCIFKIKDFINKKCSKNN